MYEWIFCLDMVGGSPELGTVKGGTCTCFKQLCLLLLRGYGQESGRYDVLFWNDSMKEGSQYTRAASSGQI